MTDDTILHDLLDRLDELDVVDVPDGATIEHAPRGPCRPDDLPPEQRATYAHLADAIRRYRQRLVRTGDPAVAADAAPDPPAHIEVRSDGRGNLVVFRSGEVVDVREAPGPNRRE